jgi:hypothetical protein
MLYPLTPLTFKLAIYDQAEHNLATREAATFACLQQQLVKTWQAAWGPGPSSGLHHRFCRH